MITAYAFWCMDTATAIAPDTSIGFALGMILIFAPMWALLLGVAYAVGRP